MLPPTSPSPPPPAVPPPAAPTFPQAPSSFWLGSSVPPSDTMAYITDPASGHIRSSVSTGGTFAMPVYNYAGYFDPSVSVYAFDAFIDFDASLLEYEGCEKNPAFKAFHTSFAPELADMPSKRKLVISAFQTSTSLVPLNGFFRYFTLTFRMNATAEPGPATTGIDVYF
eukprot:6309732-Prymnesium_polylepis.1